MKKTYNGCDISVAEGVRRYGDTTEHFTYAESEFPESLRLLLLIKSPRSLLSDILTSNPMSLGRPKLDRQFLFQAYHPDVLQRLLLTDFESGKTRNLAGDLLIASEIFNGITITDDKVYVERSWTESDTALTQLVETTTYLARRFHAARHEFSLPAWDAELSQNWRVLANDTGLVYQRQDVTIEGCYKGFLVRVFLDTEKQPWQTKISLQFPRPLNMGLEIMRENAIHRALSWLGLQDIEAGIEEFDKEFLVKARNSGAASQMLNVDFCRQMVVLGRLASDIGINDTDLRLTFDQMLSDGKILKSYLEAAVTTAKMTGAHASPFATPR